MAHENIEITNPNFCLTPQAGTFGTINTDELTTIFRVKSTSGGFINDYTLSSNILNEIVAVEYVGPLNLSAPIDNVTYFTLEKIPDLDGAGQPTVTSSKCIIKRWELDVSSSLLNLKQQITKYTTGNYYYDVSGMGVEHYHRSFLNPNQGGINYLDINNSSRIETGNKLFLGPSTDTDNIGATETITVSHISGDRVYLSGYINYQYVAGDPITFYNNIYLISKIGYGGATTRGTLFKLSAYSGNIKEYTTSGVYTDVTGAKWSIISDALATINDTQLLFIRPYDSYFNWRSMFLGNVEDNDADIFSVYDVVFDNYNIYKLMRNVTRRDVDGNKITYPWSTYNYQQDSLVPYTNNVTIYTDKAQLNGYTQVTALYIQVRDQFGVSLRDVNVNLYMDGGDVGALFDPLNGQAITDINGEASIDYISGSTYTGLTDIKVKTDKGSPFTGSEYVWNLIRLRSEIETTTIMDGGGLFQKYNHVESVSGRQIYDPYKNTHNDRGPWSYRTEIGVPPVYLNGYSFFTAAGGNWVEAAPDEFEDSYASCWHWFTLPEGRLDKPNTSCFWDVKFGPPDYESKDGFYPMPHRITQPDEFTQKKAGSATKEHKAGRIKQFLWYWVYTAGVGQLLEDGFPLDTSARQLDVEFDLQLSQLKLSKHTHYVDGNPVDELITNVSLDQFIFVEDAIPKFWSEKNPRETYIWIRLRPFAFNLDGTTLRFYVREVWTENDIYHDTNYYEVTSLGSITYFDAGSGLLGIEFMYQPAQIFHHNAIVYVHLEIYDTAADPNYIYVDYWFKVIPDFNSPYLINMDPDREEDYVPIDKNIYFEIKDDGAGIDITTLEVFLNSRIIVPSDIVKVSDYHYKITCDVSYDLQFSKSYVIGVKVSDVSNNRNFLRDSYRFFTAESSEPWFTGFDPKLCKRGMPRFTDVSFVVLGNGHGVDEDTIRLQVADRDVTDKSNILPIIYRVS